MQERRNSSALAMELRLSCTNPSIRSVDPHTVLRLFEMSDVTNAPMTNHWQEESLSNWNEESLFWQIIEVFSETMIWIHTELRNLRNLHSIYVSRRPIKIKNETCSWTVLQLDHLPVKDCCLSGVQASCKLTHCPLGNLKEILDM